MTEDQLRDIVANLADVGEDLHHEFKEAAGGLPHDLWETYSAFANIEGGVIVMGVHEDITSHTLEPVGVKDAPSLVKSIWDTLGNPKRVSADVLAPSGVCVAEYEGKTFVAIDVPRADRYARPVSVYDKRRKGLVPFVRRGESDRVAEGEMMRILSYDSMPDADGRPLLDFDLEALNKDTIHRYRTVFAALRDQHPWAREPVEDFLFHIRAAQRDESGVLRPTLAGLLAFGDSFQICAYNAFYFLDYREEKSDAIRWTDRFHSNEGDWSGNVIDFYLDVMGKLDRALPSPFGIQEGGIGHAGRSQLKDACNELVANALVHAYYGGQATVRVILKEDWLTVTNSGTFVIDPALAVAGGTSAPRNPALMQILGHLGRIDRAGTGLNAVWRLWEREFGAKPTIEQLYEPLELRIMAPLGRGAIPANGTELQLGTANDTVNGTVPQDGTANGTVNGTVPQDGTANGTVNGTVRDTAPQDGTAYDTTEERVLRLLAENPSLSYERIAERLAISRRSVARAIKALRERQSIVRDGSDKTGKWIVAKDGE